MMRSEFLHYKRHLDQYPQISLFFKINHKSLSRKFDLKIMWLQEFIRKVTVICVFVEHFDFRFITPSPQSNSYEWPNNF